MPSTHKTDYLGLNQWLGSDKPKRTDFNEDNERVDAAVQTHVMDGQAHLTQEERGRWNAPFVTGGYTGDGVNGRTVTIGFRPSALLVCAAEKTPFVFSSSQTQIRCAFATAHGVSKGVELCDEGFVVYNPAGTTPDGETPRLNSSDGTYFYVAYR